MYDGGVESSSRAAEINDLALAEEVSEQGHSSDHRGGSSGITAAAP